MNNRNAYFDASFKTRETVHDDGQTERYIDGYFIVYDRETELFPGFFEKIAKGAADSSLENNDIRVLFNHNTDIVLGRKSSGTAEFRSDEHGLHCSVHVNESDTQAMDAYNRVKRGDITGCSFGFIPVREEYEDSADGSVHCTVSEADIMEVSVCSFPAYPQTEIVARQRAHEACTKHKVALRKAELKKKLEELKNA